MAVNPLHNKFKDLNLNDSKDLRRIFYEDKHTRVEGLCSETVFIEDIIQKNPYPVTYDFWFSLHYKGYHVYKLLVDKNASLNELDYLLLDKFAAAEEYTIVRIVYFEEESREFYQIPYVKGMRYDTLEGMGTMLAPANNYEAPDQKHRNSQRLQKACDFLEERNLLKEMAVKRLFADYWIYPWIDDDKLKCSPWRRKDPPVRGGHWDVDIFTKTAQGQIVALEVKHKYSYDSARKFGLNVGEKQLLDYLVYLEMKAIHVILEKPPQSKNIPGTDLLVAGTRWLFACHKKELELEVEPANKETSYSGETEMKHYILPVSDFKFLRFLYDDAGDPGSILFAH